MSLQDRKAMSCWFPMPFASRVRLEIANEYDTLPVFYYYRATKHGGRFPGSFLAFTRYGIGSVPYRALR